MIFVLAHLEYKRWKVRCKFFKSLVNLSVDEYRMCTWWVHAYHDHVFARQNRVIVRHLLNTSMYLEQICPCCNLNAANDASHILFVCTCNDKERDMLWCEVRMSTPATLFTDMEQMPIGEKTKFILNACNSHYIREWKPMFDSISNFVCKMLKVYKVNINPP